MSSKYNRKTTRSSGYEFLGKRSRNQNEDSQPKDWHEIMATKRRSYQYAFAQGYNGIGYLLSKCNEVLIVAGVDLSLKNSEIEKDLGGRRQT